jgi:hypothetical protein
MGNGHILGLFPTPQGSSILEFTNAKGLSDLKSALGCVDLFLGNAAVNKYFAHLAQVSQQLLVIALHGPMVGCLFHAR